MEQNYHFIRNTIKLLGITLLVYAFMKWLLPMVLPFFVAFYLAGAFRRSACRKKEHKTLLILRNLLIVGGVCLLLWYLVKEFMDLWGRREELLYWEGAKESGLFGEAYEKLMAKFNTEQMLDHFVDNVASPFGGMQDTLGGMVALAVTLVATILMTKDYALLQEQIKKNTFGQVVVSLAKDLSVVGGDYLRAQGIIMLIITAICIVALLLTGNPYAVLVGVFIGFCDALPFIGIITDLFALGGRHVPAKEDRAWHLLSFFGRGHQACSVSIWNQNSSAGASVLILSLFWHVFIWDWRSMGSGV